MIYTSSIKSLQNFPSHKTFKSQTNKSIPPLGWLHGLELAIGITCCCCWGGGLFPFQGDACPKAIAVKAEVSSPMRSSAPADDAVGGVDWLVVATVDAIFGEEETGVCYRIKI